MIRKENTTTWIAIISIDHVWWRKKENCLRAWTKFMYAVWTEFTSPCVNSIHIYIYISSTMKKTQRANGIKFTSRYVNLVHKYIFDNEINQNRKRKPSQNANNANKNKMKLKLLIKLTITWDFSLGPKQWHET
jgi:hypothetical protein